MNKPNPDADLLRRAATLARETANAATCVPWTAELHRHRQTGAPVGAEVHPVVKMEGNGDGGVSTHADAQHLALWHPGVALAVATWLEDVADLHEPHPHAYGCDWCSDEDWPCADTRNALAVARALLGKDA